MAKKTPSKSRKSKATRHSQKLQRASKSSASKSTVAKKRKGGEEENSPAPQTNKDVLLGLTQRIDQKLTKVEKKLATIEHEEEQELNAEKKIARVEQKIVRSERRIEKKEEEIEKVILRIGTFTFKKKYLFELIRGTAGAFLGVGIGANLVNASKLAEQLGWLNVFGILIFILAISALLIYKNERDYIKEHGLLFVPRRLVELYLICLIIELIGFGLFGVFPSSFALALKALIIGSYAAMSGAVSFTIAW